MARKLKVFQTRLGFYDSVVAAASQAAALRAWGTHHNLFADDMAQLATDEKAIEAALQQPDVPLKRAIGTEDAFNSNPGLPKLPNMPHTGKSKAKARTLKAKPQRIDRSALDRAGAALLGLAEERRREEQDLREQQAAIAAEERTLAQRRRDFEAKQTAAAKRFEALILKAEAAAERERKAYERAGGT